MTDRFEAVIAAIDAANDADSARSEALKLRLPPHLAPLVHEAIPRHAGG